MKKFVLFLVICLVSVSCFSQRINNDGQKMVSKIHLNINNRIIETLEFIYDGNHKLETMIWHCPKGRIKKYIYDRDNNITDDYELVFDNGKLSKFLLKDNTYSNYTEYYYKDGLKDSIYYYSIEENKRKTGEEKRKIYESLYKTAFYLEEEHINDTNVNLLWLIVKPFESVSIYDGYLYITEWCGEIHKELVEFSGNKSYQYKIENGNIVEIYRIHNGNSKLFCTIEYLY